MASRMLAAAAVLGFLAVVLGAFGAHGLRSRLTADELGWFETGVRYHLVHALALALCGVLARTGSAPRLSARCFLAGTILFSGSLYLLALTSARWLGAVTPFGGVALAVGWLGLLPHCRPREPAP